MAFRYPFSVFLLSLAPFSLALGDIPRPLLATDLACGKLVLGGQLSVNSDGLTILRVYPDTTQEYQLVIFGFPPSELIGLQELSVSLEARVFRGKKGQYPRLQYIRLRSVITETEAHSFPVQQLSIEPCRGAK